MFSLNFFIVTVGGCAGNVFVVTTLVFALFRYLVGCVSGCKFALLD